MITKQMALQFLSQMPDEAVIQAFSTATGMQAPQSMDDPMIGAMQMDDGQNSVKPWSQVTIDGGDTSRPALADKDYMLNKMAMGQQDKMRGSGMPMDSTEGAYGMGNG